MITRTRFWPSGRKLERSGAGCTFCCARATTLCGVCPIEPAAAPVTTTAARSGARSDTGRTSAGLTDLPGVTLRGLEPFERHRHGAPERLPLGVPGDVPGAHRRAADDSLRGGGDLRAADTPDARRSSVLDDRAVVGACRDEPERERLARRWLRGRRLEALHDERRLPDLDLVRVEPDPRSEVTGARAA